MEKNLKQVNSDCLKIVVFGPESSGKTTLSKKLAAHYNALWIEEYAREYLQEKWDKEKKICELEDMIPIAVGQIKLENEFSIKSDKLLICDTDLLETKVYSEEFYGGFVDDKLDKAAKENTYNLYLLTYIDTPWEEDDLRDRPAHRLEMFNAFENALKIHKKPYILLKGDKETRLQKAIEAIDKIVSEKENLHSFSDSF